MRIISWFVLYDATQYCQYPHAKYLFCFSYNVCHLLFKILHYFTLLQLQARANHDNDAVIRVNDKFVYQFGAAKYFESSGHTYKVGKTTDTVTSFSSLRYMNIKIQKIINVQHKGMSTRSIGFVCWLLVFVYLYLAF